MPPHAALLLATLVGLPLAAGQDAPRGSAEAPAVWRLGAVEVVSRDIYSDETVEESHLARAVNATHWTTREAVVRRELWIAPGEPIRAADAEELERNLRATGLFAEVDVTLRPAAEPGVADLVVETRDRLSLVVGASASVVGTVGSFNYTLGESNLLGWGDRVSLAYSGTTEDEYRGAFAYRDRHFLGSWVRASASAGRTEEGPFSSVSFEKPFKHLTDRHSWRFSAASSETARDYYDAGKTVAEVPLTSGGFEAFTYWRRGPADRIWTTGLGLWHADRSFDAARGPAAAGIDVPGDTRSTFAGASLGYDRIFGYRKVNRLDTLGYEQDLVLEAGWELLAGGRVRTEEGEDERVEPDLTLGTCLAFELRENSYASLRANGHVRAHGDDAQGWAVALSLRAFELGYAPHTLAARLAFDEVFEDEGLPAELTLGEESGLRGYPTREFSGTRSVRLNVEDRLDFDARVGSFDLGGVVFFDVGWIEDHGEGFGRPLRSVGVGLRIGSTALMGPRVARIDLAFPLDEIDGRDFDPLLSIALGQVFGF